MKYRIKYLQARIVYRLAKLTYRICDRLTQRHHRLYEEIRELTGGN